MLPRQKRQNKVHVFFSDFTIHQRCVSLRCCRCYLVEIGRLVQHSCPFVLYIERRVQQFDDGDFDDDDFDDGDFDDDYFDDGDGDFDDGYFNDGDFDDGHFDDDGDVDDDEFNDVDGDLDGDKIME